MRSGGPIWLQTGCVLAAWCMFFFPGCFGEMPDTSDFETTGKNFIGLSLYTLCPDGSKKI